MDLEAELDRLFGLPLGEFIAERNELAKRLRQAGDRQAADRVKGLVKPNLTAWAVNQLHFRAPDELAALVAAGQGLRAAHLAGAEAHRAAMAARREAISTLLALTSEILKDGGHRLSRTHRQRISRTLEALASQGGEPGRLSRDLEPAGFDALSDLAAALGTTPHLRLVTPETEPPPTAGDRTATPAAPPEGPGTSAGTIDFTAERQRRQEKARREQRRELEGVEVQLAAAREAAKGLAAEAAELERQAADAGGAQGLAEGLAAQATAAAEEAERRAREAREGLAAARREAESATAAARRAAGDLAAARGEVERLAAERRRLEESSGEDHS